MRKLGGLKRTSEPRKWNTDLIGEARDLYLPFHARVKHLQRFYRRNRDSKEWQELLQVKDRNCYGEPGIPQSIVNDLPFESATYLARQWTAQELNRNHPGIKVSASQVKANLKQNTGLTSHISHMPPGSSLKELVAKYCPDWDGKSDVKFFVNPETGAIVKCEQMKHSKVRKRIVKRTS